MIDVERQTAYCVTFNDGSVYKVEIGPAPETPQMFAALVYRVVDGKREGHPMLRSDGSPLEFQAAREQTALAVAYGVLLSVGGNRLKSIVECDPG